MKEGKETPAKVVTDRRGMMRCRICHCTEDRACWPPCSWSEASLCSTCARAVHSIAITVRHWSRAAYHRHLTALFYEVTAEVAKLDASEAALPDKRTHDGRLAIEQAFERLRTDLKKIGVVQP